MIEEKILELMNWCNKNRPDAAPITVERGAVYFKLITRGSAAYCFIPIEDHSTKQLGDMKSGDLMMPATYNQPAKHARGKLFDESTWENAFDKYGMRYFR